MPSGERIDQPLVLGELVERFAETVPLHHATRIWLGRNSELVEPRRMRHRAVLLELYHYPMVWQPERNYRRITDAQIVIPQGRPCGQCGSLFFSYTKSVNCGLSCSRKSYWRARGAGGRWASMVAAE